MQHLRFVSLGLLTMAAFGCQKTALEQQREATRAQENANQVALTERDRVAQVAASAAQQAAEKTAAVRNETDKKIEAAHREAGNRVNSAADDAKNRIVDAQMAADEAAKQAAQAFQKARLGLENDVGKQLDTIDKRTEAVRQKLSNDKNASPDRQAGVKEVESKSKTLRANLHTFELETARSIESFQNKLQQSLEDLRKAVDKLESKPEST